VSGIEYLLDTNIVIGLFKRHSETLALIRDRYVTIGRCAYSAITRMELLGYPGLTADDEATIQTLLARMVYLPVTLEIEDMAISIRRQRRIKLPDAIIAATAKVHRLELLTLDKDCSKRFDRVLPRLG